jgi:Gpi18-like mannosyltransferase
MNSIILWAILRLLTSIFTAFASSIKPIQPLEVRVSLFPPSSPITQWLERVFLSPWLRWDAEWYLRIVTQGYSASDGTAQFHPLYPWLAVPLAKIGIAPLLSLLIISSLAGAALLYTFHRLAEKDLSSADASHALIFFAFAPPAFILFAPYPEALFLLFAVLCLFYARRNSWWLSALMGGLATLTRQQGIFLLVPLSWELWQHSQKGLENRRKVWRNWLSLILIPAGYLLWLAYRANFLSDMPVGWSNFQEFIYSFLISSSASQVVQVQEFLWPWQALYLAISKLLAQPDVDIWVNLITGGLFILLLVLTWKHLRMSYRLYSLVITWISFSYYTGPVHPYMGLPRHLLLAFPVFIGLAALVHKPWSRLMVVGFSVVGACFLMGLYVLHAWVP